MKVKSSEEDDCSWVIVCRFFEAFRKVSVFHIDSTTGRLHESGIANLKGELGGEREPCEAQARGNLEEVRDEVRFAVRA